MKRALVSFASGATLAIGLGVAGMTDPAKVIGFLDLGGRWDPSLLGVMATAVALGIVVFRVVLSRRAPVLDDRFHLPTPRRVDARLVLGAALFGVGWGLSGYCPGPALASIVTGDVSALVFVSAMVMAMAAAASLEPMVARWRSPSLLAPARDSAAGVPSPATSTSRR